jgi:long-chain acyl-CoA synthetase
MNTGTLTRLFFDAVERHAGHPAAFRSKVGGVWTPITHPEAEARVRSISLGLRDLGVRPGDRVAIVSESRPEWVLADFACLCTRVTDVPVYPTLPASQIEHILRDAGATVAFCSTADQAGKLVAIQAALSSLKHVIVFDPKVLPGRTMSLAELERRGRAMEASHPTFRQDALAVQPDDLATLIYTSGTSGEPKGVMLTHGNICSNIDATLQIFPISSEDECLAMLPLSHILERMVDYVFFKVGVILNYAESFEAVATNLGEVRPTVVVTVPRLFEKVYSRVLENALSGSGVKRRIFFWAKKTGEACASYALSGLPIPAVLRLKQALADRLVFSKLRARTGGRIRCFLSGSAPLSAEVARFFFAAGMPVYEGYGLTETSPVLTLNPVDRPKLGTVGKAVPGVRLKIAADGEILALGPNVMRGYYNKPEATQEAIDADGWFHTGDIGELDGEGYLRITDRKKDLIKTAGGKYVAPQPIENRVKLNKFVANAVVLGDKRKFPIILVVPNYEQLEPWARERKLAYRSRAELIALPDAQAKVEREVMGMLRDLAKFEMPKKVALVERDFTIDSGELTPTLKVKRRAVETNYRALIDRVYAEIDPTAAAIEG